MQQESSTSGNTLSAQMEAAAALLASDAEGAATGSSEVLDCCPGQAQALLLLLSALKLIGADDGATDLLKGMVEDHPNLAAIHYELGLQLAANGSVKEAIAHLQRTVALEPKHPTAWRMLGHQLARNGDSDAATRAYVQHLRLSLRELKLIEDATAIGAGEETKAEKMLSQAVAVSPTDVYARRQLGELLLRIGQIREAKESLERALQLAPKCVSTRFLYGMSLTQMMDWKGANAQIEMMMKDYPNHPHLLGLLIGNLGVLGERQKALDLLENFHPEEANTPLVWNNYALGARTLGVASDAVIAAYRKSVELDPSYGASWWGLADLKTYKFSADEIRTMREQLKRNDIPEGTRSYIEFALGNALEAEKAYADSFEHYRKGNELRRGYFKYNADAMHQDMMAVKSVFTPEFFNARKNLGSPARDPIFIVGMPRAGSTLIEQILASHSQVEGTMELAEMSEVVVNLMKRHPEKSYPYLLADLAPDEFRELGEGYLEHTQYQRKLGRPFFTDKAGNNFLHIGLIQVILPNAKIIDARRHPLACGFSCYKQSFAPGSLLFTYDQTEIGRYYRDYVEAVTHFDIVLRGRVHRVIHEDLVRDPEAEIRRLLEYCELPFEENCLRFYETDRSVRTSSSEQVRQPIQKKTVEAWQHYESWLQPMKDALGDVWTLYPEVPRFS